MARVQVAEHAGVSPDSTARPSEDVVCVRPDAVIVLDGATTLRPGLASGGWYARLLANAIAAGLDRDPGAGLPDLLAASIRSVADEHGLLAGASPSSTVAMLRWRAGTLDALVLGDSPVVVFTDAGPEVLVDDRLAQLARRPRRGGYRDRLRAGGGYGPEHLGVLRAAGAAMDGLRNTDGGFWVAEADPAAAYRAVTRDWRLSAVDSVVLATDGVSCGVDDYRIFPDWIAVLDLARARGVRAVLEAVRAAEAGDPAGERWPRPKPHDDQAMVLVEFGRDETGAAIPD